MPIIDDYDAIAKRLREIRSATAESVTEIGDLEKWRHLARQTARAYVESRRKGPGIGPVQHHAPGPTD
jgi:hypothetical protein